jgi:hypothetical protein
MVSSDEGSVLGFLGGMRWCVVYWRWLNLVVTDRPNLTLEYCFEIGNG